MRPLVSYPRSLRQTLFRNPGRGFPGGFPLPSIGNPWILDCNVRHTGLIRRYLRSPNLSRVPEICDSATFCDCQFHHAISAADINSSNLHLMQRNSPLDPESLSLALHHGTSQDSADGRSTSARDAEWACYPNCSRQPMAAVRNASHGESRCPRNGWLGPIPERGLDRRPRLHLGLEPAPRPANAN